MTESRSARRRRSRPLPCRPCRLRQRPRAGGQNISVGSDQALALPPGNYGTLTVNGILLLNPGHYVVSKVQVGDFGRIVAVTGDVQMTVVDTLTAGRHTAIYPDFRLPALQFSISVAGSDAKDRPAASIGEHSLIRALLAAPHGTLALADHVRATGAFAAFDIAVGAHAMIKFQNGFPADSPGDHGSQQLHGYYGATADPAIAPFAGPVPNDQVIHLAIGLPGQNSPGLASFVKQISDPKSPQFRKYLTQDQFYATFGATDADYQALQTWAQTANGFVIRATYPNKLLLSVTGTAAQVERSLHANLVFRKRKDGSNFVAVDRDPSLDLSVPILHISGLTDYVLPRPLALNGTGGGGSYRAADIRNAYLGVNSNCQSLDGSGQVIGLVGFDVFNKSDVDAYDGLQLPPITDNAEVVATEGGNPTSGANVEATLDVEMVQAMAPKAKVLFFQGSTGITGHLDDILMAMATSNLPLTVASSSLTYLASDNEELALSEMAAQGVSFFQGSGDNGDVGDPQQTVDNAHLLTQTLVGGTMLSTNPLTAGLPNPVYPANYYTGESAWSGSGGGVLDGSNQICPFICSPSVPIPDYQVGVSMAGQRRVYPVPQLSRRRDARDKCRVLFAREHEL
jgi:Pro-kumamolisin, activation domain